MVAEQIHTKFVVSLLARLLQNTTHSSRANFGHGHGNLVQVLCLGGFLGPHLQCTEDQACSELESLLTNPKLRQRPQLSAGSAPGERNGERNGEQFARLAALGAPVQVQALQILREAKPDRSRL